MQKRVFVHSSSNFSCSVDCTLKCRWKNVKRIGPTISSAPLFHLVSWTCRMVEVGKFLRNLWFLRMWTKEWFMLGFPGFPFPSIRNFYTSALSITWPCSEVSSTSCPKVKRSIPSVPSADCAYIPLRKQRKEHKSQKHTLGWSAWFANPFYGYIIFYI